MDGEYKVFHLTAEPVTKTIYDEKINLLRDFIEKHNRYSGPVMKLPVNIQKVDGWGYNGNIPGPTIIVNKGDLVRIHLQNNLSEPTTINWHGLIIPNDQDGTGGNQDLVPEGNEGPATAIITPGKSGMYEFEIVNEPGTYMYHSGFNDTKQLLQGLAGLLIVLPEDGKDRTDKDFAILLQDWMVGAKGILKYLSTDRNWFTYNGLSAPNFPVLVANEGDLVRIRFANLGLFSHPIHLHGYTFQIVGTEGGPIPPSAQWPGATVTIGPGESRDIEFLATNPGLWKLHCHILQYTLNNPSYFARKEPVDILPEGGLFTYLYIQPKEQK